MLSCSHCMTLRVAIMTMMGMTMMMMMTVCVYVDARLRRCGIVALVVAIIMQ